MYPLNARGGWVIPPNAKVPDNTEIPSWSEIGNNCTLGDHCTLGNDCKLGHYCSLDSGCTLGNECKLGHYCSLDSGCTLGNYCKLGNYCSLDSGCTLGDACKPGKSCQIPNPTWRGIKASRWLTLANVDGSGRMILILQDEQGKVWAEAGCFFGTLDNFVKEAQREEKHVYVAVMSAVAKSLEDLHHA